jgi:hypothetical protein
MVLFDSFEQILVSVMDSIFLDYKSLSISSPKHNNCIEIVHPLKVSNVLADDFKMLLFLISLYQVVSP